MLVYRNPVWTAGPDLLFARDFTDVVDWGLSLQGIPNTWANSTGAGILVGVCDTGCPRHSDLNDRIAHAANFSSSYTVDDMQGHSTHVCGIIAASRNNQGIVGVAPDARLCIAKVLGDDGSGSNVGVAKGIDFCVERDCDIISMSLGGAYDPNVEAAVKRAIAAGKIVICAAGNDGYTPGQDTTNWPARLGPPVAVAAYNKAGQISTFSSRGPEVDVACPGEEILSCWLNNTYKRLSGTSMATPFCSGLAALRLSYQREQEKKGIILKDAVRNTEDFTNLIKATASDKGQAGKDNDWGWGVIDVQKWMVLNNQNPPAPTPAPAEPGKPGSIGDIIDLLGGALKIDLNAQIGDKKGIFIYAG